MSTLPESLHDRERMLDAGSPELDYELDLASERPQVSSEEPARGPGLLVAAIVTSSLLVAGGVSAVRASTESEPTESTAEASAPDVTESEAEARQAELAATVESESPVAAVSASDQEIVAHAAVATKRAGRPSKPAPASAPPPPAEPPASADAPPW